MADLGDLGQTAIVMAHPDDEVLWASSILARVAQAVICFGDVGSDPAISAGRRRAMAAFPLPNVISLAIPEAEVFGAAAWPRPAEAAYGLEVRRYPGAMRGFSPARYRENFTELQRQLRPRLAGRRAVVTHAPWGEYGHEEHVQVFRAVLSLQPELGFALWVPGYCSEKSEALMRRHLPRLGPPTPPLATDPGLGARLQAHYAAAGCWTWFDDYAWPEREVFYPWPDPRSGPPAPRRGRVEPINFIWLDWRPPGSRPRALLGRIRRRAAGLLKPRP